MPVQTSYPGVYVEEIPSGVHNIVGVTTATTAFVDFFPQGPMGVPTQVSNYTEFVTLFGGLDVRSEASYGVMQYYLNGGQTAWIVRVASGTPATAQVLLDAASPAQPTLLVQAKSPGVWGESLQVGIDYNTRPLGDVRFNLVVRRLDSITNPTKVIVSEIFRNLSMNTTDSLYAVDLVNNASQLIQLTDEGLGDLPNATAPDVIATVADPTSTDFLQVHDPSHPASDGGTADYPDGRPDATAIQAGVDTLARIDPYIFNILCLPAVANFGKPSVPDTASIAATYQYATSFCQTHRAFMIVDIPASITGLSNSDPSGIMSWVNVLETNGYTPSSYAAIYFPRLVIPDPLNQMRPRNVPVSGTMAGIYSATDSSRGVWKAPAGIGAGVGGASLATIMNDADSGSINPFGINGLRNFPTYGNVVWGARTMRGADQMADEWAYIPVRRTANYIEESLFEGLKWVVFEPNDYRLWSQIRLNVTSFMQTLFQQGAFQGASAQSAYFVKCDGETTTQTDINSGVVNVLVGFAPLKPAEFVVIQIQQMAGQTS
ncbi:phage tail sheath family protein [Granulicella sp. WH15]|uniref:phage tail sheath family protein n=1 Tax=Granulicella sp. WH15 TaxID=2602070 RepID=UPI0013676B2F|nr:phage tail sheath family protein [Granulicella sp. WH15]QHN04127.1 phage tail sheath family protein [Granulicella sp. WH15]